MAKFSNCWFKICLTVNDVESIFRHPPSWIWCQNMALWMSHGLWMPSWQVLCHVYSAVISMSKWPCQIRLEPLIMSPFFNLTASSSSILFSIKDIILSLLTGSWQFVNDASHLPLVHSLKAWLLARCHFRNTLASLHMWHTIKAITPESTGEVIPLLPHKRNWTLTDVSTAISTHTATARSVLGHGDFIATPFCQLYLLMLFILIIRGISQSVLSVFTSLPFFFYSPLFSVKHRIASCVMHIILPQGKPMKVHYCN